MVDDWGSWGYVAYTFVYTALELIIIPAIPLTMAAGVLFGVGPGLVNLLTCRGFSWRTFLLLYRVAFRAKLAEVGRKPKPA